jgi:ribonucleoside-diphosphate reductase subunit M1
MANKRNASSSGILTPTTPSAATPLGEELKTPEQEVTSPNVEVPPGTPDTTAVTGTATAVVAPNVSFDGTDKEAKAAKAAAEDPEFAAALARQRERELEEAKLMCSIENKDACMMCSG